MILTEEERNRKTIRMSQATKWLVLARDQPGLIIEAIAALAELASHAHEGYGLEVLFCSAEVTLGAANDGGRGLGHVRCSKYENEFCHGYDINALQLVREVAE